MKNLYFILIFFLFVASCAKQPHKMSEHEKPISSTVEVTEFAETKLKISFNPSKVANIPKKDNYHLYIAYITRYGWIRIGDTKIDWENGTATAITYHPGEYAIVMRTKPYGIEVLNESLESEKNPLLLVHGCFNSKITWQPFLDLMVKKGKFDRPIWIFDYPQNLDLEEIGILLSDELIRLENQYDDYKLDFYAHGLGGIVVTQFVGNLDRQINIDRFLSIAPPFIGTNMVRKDVLDKLIEQDVSQTLPHEDLSLLYVYYDILREQASILLPDSRSLDQLFEKYNEVNFGTGDIKLERQIMDEALLGNAPWIKFNKRDVEFPELKDGFGDGIIDSRKNNYQGRISTLTHDPFHNNHFNIIHDQNVIDKMVEFLDVPVLYFPDKKDESTFDDLLLQSETNIQLDQWRGYPTPFMRDYAKNILASCDSNAILFTNGDHDTFYPWELQLKENFRSDVRVVNLSLLNVPWFIKMLRNIEPKIPINLTETEIEQLKPKIWKKRKIQISVPYSKQVKAKKELQRMGMNDVIPEETIEFTLSQTIGSKSQGGIRVQDLMILRIINDTKWFRPIHFAITVTQANLIGLNPYLILEGFVYKLKPYKTEGIPPEKSRKYLLEKFEYSTLNDPKIHKNKDALALSTNYIAVLARLAQFYLRTEQFTEVCNILNEMISKIPKENMYFTSYKSAIGTASIFHQAECLFDYNDFLAAVDPGIEKTMIDYLLIEKFYMEIVKDTSKADYTFQELLKITELPSLKKLRDYYEKFNYGNARLEQIVELIEQKSE